LSFVRNPWVRGVIVVLAAAGVVALLWWRVPAWNGVVDAFSAVEWRWVAAAVGLNLLSVVARALAWRTVIVQAAPPPHPGFPLVFSAFSVGLFANAVLPGRIGELARVAVLNRRMGSRPGMWPRLLGTVFAHRVFDLVAVIVLILYVVMTAHIPDWAVTSLIAVVVAGVTLFTIAMISARQYRVTRLEEGVGAFRKVVRLARYGLGVMRSPAAAVLACFFQVLGWTLQLFAVYTTMLAFDIHVPLPAAGLVLVLMNVATLFPLWPGNIGLVQAAVALPLFRYYDVAKATGIAFGFGLQAIEASVGIGVGLLFLAREGLSFAMLKVMPDAAQAEVPEEAEQRHEPMPKEDAEQPRARMSG
jgi:glycosyltransferase 2 family protein